MLYIGLVGRAGSGKDTAADVFQSMKPTGVSRVAFAQPLKEICSLSFLLDEDAFTDRKKKEAVDPRWGLSPREMCQRMGTDFFRKIDPDFWIKRMDLNLKNMEESSVVLFTDVRFINEAEYITGVLGGILVYIDADDRLGECGTHSSELGVYEILAVMDIFRILKNNSDIEIFRNQVQVLFEELQNQNAADSH
jgi:hypothetical protein